MWIGELVLRTFAAASGVAMFWVMYFFALYTDGRPSWWATMWWWIAVVASVVITFLFGSCWLLVGYLSLRIWLTERRLRP